MTNNAKRGHKKAKIGTVVSNKMNKTVMVLVERLVKQPLYGKYVKKKTKYMAHDEKAECKEGDKVKIVYTPLHGTGNIPCREISKRMGFKNFLVVEEQAMPDSNFSTVKSPNPEDSHAMEMATKQMLEVKADACYGTDPDGDRKSVV